MGPAVLLIAFLTFGMGFVIWAIAADKKRFLARFDLAQWEEHDYLRALPNFLQALHDNYFTIAWPGQPNAVAVALFQFRANAFLRKKPAAQRREFLRQHVILFALREVLFPYLQDFFWSEQQRLIGNRILEMEDTSDRDRLIVYLDSIREARRQFHGQLTELDRQTLIEMINRKIIPTWRAADAIFQEHGFCLMPQFSQLRRWDEMSGSELVQELPKIDQAKKEKELRFPQWA